MIQTIAPLALALARRLRRAIPFGMIVLAACNGDRQKDTPQGPATERRVSVTRWDTLWVLGGELEDSVLLRPSRLAAAGDRVYVFDAGAGRLVAVSAADGSVAWMSGRQGGGPGEFKQVRDLEVGPDGRPMLLDMGNARITTLDRAGAVVHEARLRSVGYADQFAPLPGGRAVLLTEHPDSALAVVDSAGGIVERLGLPWDGFARLDPLVRQGTLASGADGRWAFGFGMGDGWFAFADTRAQGERRPYVEAAPFPRVVQKQEGNTVTTELESYSPCSACSMGLDGTDLYVLFGGRTERRHAILDRYDLRSGRYRESLALPAKAGEAVIAGGTVFLLVEDPAPALLALRPRGQR